MNYWPHFILRVSIVFILVYSAIGSFYNPNDWVVYLPDIIRRSFDSDVIVLQVLSLLNLLLAVWILSNRAIRWPITIVLVLSALIIIFNPNEFMVLFRDISTILIAIALLIDSPPREKAKHI